MLLLLRARRLLSIARGLDGHSRNCRRLVLDAPGYCVCAIDCPNVALERARVVRDLKRSFCQPHHPRGTP